jgi:hypothetical protein
VEREETGHKESHRAGGILPSCKVVVKVEFSANWHKLVKRYKNIVPTCVRYQGTGKYPKAKNKAVIKHDPD